MRPGAVRAAVSQIFSPTSREPVKAMSATRGCATSRAPTSSPGPGTKCITPLGTPASIRMSKKRAAMTGDCSAGFITTAFPVTRAAAVMPQRIASGKFHGAITAATPRAP